MEQIALWLVSAWMVVAAAFIAFVMFRYPEFRRAFFKYWSGPEVAKRMERFAERRR